MSKDPNPSSRKYDVLLIGASGFTGKYVLEQLIKLRLGSEDIGSGGKPKFEIAIAGRSRAKLDDLVSKVSQKYTTFSGTIDCIEVDFSQLENIVNVTNLSNVVISCVGPYQLFGEPIVEACVLSGTHYVDITGEPRFVEAMFCKYDEGARSKDIMVVHYCGFDSVPADVGSLSVRQKLDALGKATLSIEMFVTLDSTLGSNAINFTTYQSALVAIGGKRPDLSEYKRKLPVCTTYGKEIYRPLIPRYSTRTNSYFTTFPIADPLVVSMGQRVVAKYHNEATRYYNGKGLPLTATKSCSFYCFKNARAAFVAFVCGLFILLFCQFRIGVKFLLKYPHWATFGLVQPPSSGGPSQKKIDAGSFKVKFLAKGLDKGKLSDYINNPKGAEADCEIEAVFEGPDAGYEFTSKCVALAALTILTEKVKGNKDLPRGVLTPSLAFGSTSFFEKLLADPKIHFKIDAAPKLYKI